MLGWYWAHSTCLVITWGQIGGAETGAGGWGLLCRVQVRDTGDGLRPRGREVEVTAEIGHASWRRALALESSRPGVKVSSGTSQLCDLGETLCFSEPLFSHLYNGPADFHHSGPR